MKKFFSATFCVASACVCAAFAACGTSYESKIARNFIFNVNADIVLTADFSDAEVSARAEELNNQAKEFLSRLEASLSASVTTSYVCAFNRASAGETVQIDNIAYNVLKIAQSVYRLTDGCYNPAVYYSVDLYGFAPRASESATPYDRERVTSENGDYLPLPDEKYVSAFCELSQYFGGVEVWEENGAYYARKPDDAFVEVDGVRYELSIDLGGIGKGYCADVIGEMMREYGFDYGYFNFGSSSMSILQSYESKTGEWDLNIDDPRNANSSYLALKVSSVGLSTSGDNENYYEIDGVRYCHIIDPFTGSPVRSGVASVTVIGGSAAEDDALTTALTVMGADMQKTVDFINQNLAGKKVVLLWFDGGVGKIITNVPEEITVLNGSYQLANTVQDGKIILNVS